MEAERSTEESETPAEARLDHNPWSSSCRKWGFGEPFKQDARCPICEGGGYVAIPQA